MKYIPATHPDYEELVDTTIKLDAQAESINEGKRHLEQQAHFKRLQESIRGLPLVSHHYRQSIWDAV